MTSKFWVDTSYGWGFSLTWMFIPSEKYDDGNIPWLMELTGTFLHWEFSWSLAGK